MNLKKYNFFLRLPYQYELVYYEFWSLLVYSRSGCYVELVFKNKSTKTIHEYVYHLEFKRYIYKLFNIPNLIALDI